LFALCPDAHYADFHERALFNHILASIDPDDGWACYMVPVGRGVRREYERNMLDGGFTCCTGSSLESHALHADGIYYESDDTLYVNLYAPSSAEWAAAGLKLAVDTDFPEGESATLKLTLETPKVLTLALRRPYWAGEAFKIKVNGEAVADDVLADPRVPAYGRRRANAQGQSSQAPSYYIKLRRTWKTGDTVEVTLPKSLRLEPLPDNPRRVAILWGPLVLAGDLGPEPERGRRRQRSWTEQERIPVFVAAEQPVADWLKPVEGKPGHFRTAGVGREKDVEFSPFYRLHRRTYGVYWDLFTQPEWKVKEAEYAAEQERLRKLELATIGYVQPGEMQPERDYNFQGAGDARPTRIEGRPGRRARSWFSFDLPVDAEHPMAVIVTYYSGERRRGAVNFDILADGQRIAEQEVTRSEPARFYDVEYVVPANLVQGKEEVTIKFQAQ
ncbi:MAG: glycoside hydrolase family 127 protein, partial [Gemmatimonadota bacterium]